MQNCQAANDGHHGKSSVGQLGGQPPWPEDAVGLRASTTPIRHKPHLSQSNHDTPRPETLLTMLFRNDHSGAPRSESPLPPSSSWSRHCRPRRREASSRRRPDWRHAETHELNSAVILQQFKNYPMKSIFTDFQRTGLQFQADRLSLVRRASCCPRHPLRVPRRTCKPKPRAMPTAFRGLGSLTSAKRAKSQSLFLPFLKSCEKGFLKLAGTTTNPPPQQVGGSRIPRLAIILPSAALLRRINYSASDMTNDL